MKTKKLIPLLDYVNELNQIPMSQEEQSKAFFRTVQYGKFLSQPLKLSQFVPCDEYGAVMKEPTFDNYMQPKEIDRQYEAYNKAKSNVLFEGCKLIGTKHVQYKTFIIGLGFKNGTFNTIEDLTKYNDTKHFLTLTENAVKTING